MKGLKKKSMMERKRTKFFYLRFFDFKLKEKVIIFGTTNGLAYV